MSVILVIQPDASQAKILHDVARTIHAQLVVVDSIARALDAIDRQLPDLILVSPFLSPRHEDTLMARLRSLDGASHVQTVSIPQFKSNKESAQKKKSAFGFGKKKKDVVAVGADPVAFAEEMAALLTRAKDAHGRASAAETMAATIEPLPSSLPEILLESHSDSYGESDESESETDGLSVFSAEPEAVEPDPEPEPIVWEPAAPVQVEEPIVEWSAAEPTTVDTPTITPQSRSIADEIDQLVRQLGLDASSQEGDFDLAASPDDARNGPGRSPKADPVPQVDAEAVREAAIAEARATAEREAREASAVEIARVLAEAEALRESAVAEARAAAENEARQVLEADRQRVQAETEHMRVTAIAEARAVAEREARDTLAAEVARVRSEAEVSFSDALNRVKVEAEEAERRGVEAEREKARQLNEEAQKAFALELARVRAEVEQSLTAQLDAARAEAERVRLAEAEAVRARAAVEHQLKADLERLRFATAQTRKADETETRKAAQLIKQLEAELADVRAKAEERKGNELEEIRAQMAEMREAAAQQVRAAAAEAVKAEVARATVQAAAAIPAARPTAVIAQFPAREAARVERDEQEAEATRDVSDYLRLWESKAAKPAPVREAVEPQTPEAALVFVESARRYAKWALPVAGCLILVATTGTAINTVSSFLKPDERPAVTVQAMQEQPPFIEVVEKRVGKLQVDSTPSGAEAILDGKKYGQTPVTIPDLDAGLHTLVLKSAAGSITRKVTIKANQTTLLAEAIYSGWLAIFSPIPVKVIVDGRPVSLTDDGRVMTTPGRHTVEFSNEQFGYRATQSLDVQPGATTAHTLDLPMGTLRVKVPEGADVRVDGQPSTGIPSDGMPIAIGAHEVSAAHPDLGVRRASVDVKYGRVTDVTLHFDQ